MGVPVFEGHLHNPLCGPLWFGVVYRWLVGLGGFLQRSQLRGRSGRRHCPLRFGLGVWINVPLPVVVARVLDPLGLESLLQRPPLHGGVVSLWLVALGGFLQHSKAFKGQL